MMPAKLSQCWMPSASFTWPSIWPRMVRLVPTSSSREQQKHYADRLLEARAALTAFHQTASLFSMPQQQSADIDGLQSTASQLKETEVKIVEQQARLVANHREVSSLSDRMTTQVRAIPNQMAVQQLSTMLADLQNRRITLAVKFKPGDRLIKELDQQIASTQEQLHHLQTEPATEETTDVNPIRETAASEISRGQVELRALEARKAALTTTRTAYLDELTGMEKDSIKLQQLQQEETEALDNYKLYTRKMDEARLADWLDRAKFSNVAMVETPTVVANSCFSKAGGEPCRGWCVWFSAGNHDRLLARFRTRFQR